MFFLPFQRQPSFAERNPLAPKEFSTRLSHMELGLGASTLLKIYKLALGAEFSTGLK